jgi:hypothetical protein
MHFRPDFRQLAPQRQGDALEVKAANERRDPQAGIITLFFLRGVYPEGYSRTAQDRCRLLPGSSMVYLFL